MLQVRKILYKGSVKDIYQTSDSDILSFKYSDRFSVFDWGEMPDLIEKKGEALATMSELFFHYLKDIPNHFIERGDQNSIFVKKVEVPKQMDFYQSRPINTLVPLEVIFRFGIPEGSSFKERMGHSDFEKDLEEYKGEGLFPQPIIDFSTKLEKRDRYLTYQEAKDLSFMEESEFKALKEITRSMATKLFKLFEKMDLILWDGKFEFAFDQSNPRSFFLVDSIGIDELRLSKEEELISKEFLRDFYRKTNWYQKLIEYKKQYQSSFKEKMLLEDLTPPPLSLEVKKQASDLYCAFCNSLAKGLSKPIPFEESLNLEEYFEKYKTEDAL